MIGIHKIVSYSCLRGGFSNSIISLSVQLPRRLWQKNHNLLSFVRLFGVISRFLLWFSLILSYYLLAFQRLGMRFANSDKLSLSFIASIATLALKDESYFDNLPILFCFLSLSYNLFFITYYFLSELWGVL